MFELNCRRFFVSLLTVEQITDDQLDQIVELANLQWQVAPGKVKTDPEHLTHLMACHFIRAYLAVMQVDPESVIQKVEQLGQLSREGEPSVARRTSAG